MCNAQHVYDVAIKTSAAGVTNPPKNQNKVCLRIERATTTKL